MPACAVAICRNYTKTTKGTDVKYFSFPRDPHQQEEWIWRCGRETNFNIANSRICSEHFTKDDFERDLKNELLGLPVKRILKPLALPTVNICYNVRHATDYYKSSTAQTEASDNEDVSTVSDLEKQLILENDEKADESVNSEGANCASVGGRQSINKSGKLRKSRKQYICCENGKRRLTCVGTLKRKQTESDEESGIANSSSRSYGLYIQYKKQCEKLKDENYKLKVYVKSLQDKVQNPEDNKSNPTVNWEESYKALKIDYDALQSKLTNCKEIECESLKEDESSKDFEISFDAPDFHQYALRYRKREVPQKTLSEESPKIALNEDLDKDEENEDENYAEDSSLGQSIILIEIPSGVIETSNGALQPISFVNLHDIE